MSCSRQESEGFFLPTSYIQGQEIQEAKEVVEFRQGWSVAKNKGDVRKKRRRPRKVVCRHKKGMWEKKKKEKDQGRQEGGSPKGKVPCALNKNFFFGSRVFGLWETHLDWSIGSCVIFIRGSHVRRKFQERTTLRSKSSTLKGLLYAPIKRKQNLKRTTLCRLKIPLRM